MTNASLDIRILVPTEWEVLREIRLRTLLDSSYAFMSHYHRETGWSEERWRQRLDASTWVVATERGTVVGITALVGHPNEPHRVESIWVAPTHRNRGVFRGLLEIVVQVARRAGAQRTPVVGAGGQHRRVPGVRPLGVRVDGRAAAGRQGGPSP